MLISQSEDFAVGKTLNIVLTATDRVTKYSVTGTCTVDMFAPPKNPEFNPADRVADYTFTATFDSGLNAYTVNVPTTNWTPGKWTCRGMIVDNNGNTDWIYSNFILKA